MLERLLLLGNTGKGATGANLQTTVRSSEPAYVTNYRPLFWPVCFYFTLKLINRITFH